MKSTLLKILATIFLIGLIVFLLASRQKSTEKGQYEISVGKHRIFVEIMDTDAKRANGLSGRNSLSEKEGMLFIFDYKDIMPAFWMKDMLFAIDIIWINDGVVAGISENVLPEPGRSENELTLYRPPNPIDYVLEVTSGFSKENEISIGTEVDLSSFNYD